MYQMTTLGSMTWDQYTGHEHDVAELHYHWGEAYAIEWTAGHYRAYRRDTGLPLVAETVDEMFKLISANYAEHPVSRDFTPRDS